MIKKNLFSDHWYIHGPPTGPVPGPLSLLAEHDHFEKQSAYESDCTHLCVSNCTQSQMARLLPKTKSPPPTQRDFNLS